MPKTTPPIRMIAFSTLKKNLGKDYSGFKKSKIALLGDTSTQFLGQALRGMGYEYQLDLQIFESDYNQVDRQIFDPGSALYEFNPSIVVLFQSSHKLLLKYNKLNPSDYGQLCATEMEAIKNKISFLQSQLTTKLIIYNYAEIDDAVYGNYASKYRNSFLFQLRKLNYELMEYAADQANVFVCDLSSIQNLAGKKQIFLPHIYVNTDLVLSLPAIPLVATKTISIINSLEGQIKKCIVLDLDNTLWGGVIGDDGFENIQLGNLGIGKAFTEFQLWLKTLKNRGIILAVCSKNSESIAKEPFIKHPDMVLKLEDISVFMANWENKVDNIRSIQKVLNIGFDSMVFLDDNPFERNFVRQNIPEICVPELPEDPAYFLEFLYEQNLFETSNVSKEDIDRTKLYQIEAERSIAHKKFTNESDFLQSIEMKAVVQPFNKFNIPRVAQLTQRSNQFNLRTIRYTEIELEKIANSPVDYGFAFSLNDKYGDHGMIAVVILRKQKEEVLFIDTWLMSCRVLNRGLEQFILNYLCSFAKSMHVQTLKGEYIPTNKNEMVKNHYSDLGFTKCGDGWELDLITYLNKNNFIELTEAE